MHSTVAVDTQTKVQKCRYKYDIKLQINGDMSSSQSVNVTFILSMKCYFELLEVTTVALWGTDEAFLGSAVQWKFQIEVNFHRHPTPIKSKWANGPGVSQNVYILENDM